MKCILGDIKKKYLNQSMTLPFYEDLATNKKNTDIKNRY